LSFEKITNISLTDLFVEQIENKILSGELAVGEKLPSARELASLIGVSRPVISAGLIELEKMGFIEVKPRLGAFVCDYRRKGTVETLVAIMRYNGGAMRRNEVSSMFQVRRSLECLCMELIIDTVSAEDLLRMKPFLDAIHAADTTEKIAQAIFTFHHELAVLSGNVLLPLLYHSFKSPSIYLWKITVRNVGKEATYKAKADLYQALVARDKEKAIHLTNQSANLGLNELPSYTS